MIEPVQSILTLAADDGNGIDSFLEIGLFVVIAVGSILSAVFKKSAEKRQQERARQKAQEAKDILAHRTQREQAQQVAAPTKTASLGTMKKQSSLRDFVQQRTATPPPKPPPVPQPISSMFAAPPKPVILEEPDEHHLVELAPIQHLPPEEERIHAAMPSSVHPRKASVGDLVRKRSALSARRIERNISGVHEPPELAESNIHTRVNLLDPSTARAAIIFQEILSLPKALRDRPELWE
jgi:hypothetical protein